MDIRSTWEFEEKGVVLKMGGTTRGGVLLRKVG